ncbi:hemin uptake protein HemP [Polynucleobacter sp. AP-RePozz3-80-G7]|uniref:hemin uptake protein HemP n=1 Tax=unclassified Polynucleobacter TaxID=2640945 RepID=UPI001BFD4CFD|nr:hemin uptake protein HemP [Polynucleobacter sp. P1-05-14]MBU3639892.1 hemin uptake protein HemP [Polynucleobacter sp. AP-RePozz3-80-G7]QWD81129.1 hemin uptake protein HemP [Polynucleobacter sp. MWH-S4W17]
MNEKNTLDLDSKCIRSSQLLPRCILSETLLGHTKQIFILHDGHSYQLRITKLGKLILTK